MIASFLFTYFDYWNAISVFFCHHSNYFRQTSQCSSSHQPSVIRGSAGYVHIVLQD